MYGIFLIVNNPYNNKLLPSPEVPTEYLTAYQERGPLCIQKFVDQNIAPNLRRWKTQMLDPALPLISYAILGKSFNPSEFQLFPFKLRIITLSRPTAQGSFEGQMKSCI